MIMSCRSPATVVSCGFEQRRESPNLHVFAAPCTCRALDSSKYGLQIAVVISEQQSSGSQYCGQDLVSETPGPHRISRDGKHNLLTIYGFHM